MSDNRPQPTMARIQDEVIRLNHALFGLAQNVFLPNGFLLRLFGKRTREPGMPPPTGRLLTEIRDLVKRGLEQKIRVAVEQKNDKAIANVAVVGYFSRIHD